jgi:hypothetical protein
MGWKLDERALHEVEEIIDRNVLDPVGPEFMAPPERRPGAPERAARPAL